MAVTKHFKHGFTAILALMLSVTSCKTGQKNSDKSATKDVTSDVSGVPPRVVLVKNILLNIDALRSFGFRPSNNCFMTYSIATPQGDTEYYMEGYSLPCGSGIYSEHPKSEVLNSRILSLKLNDVVVHGFVFPSGVIYKHDFLFPNNNSPDQQIELLAMETPSGDNTEFPKNTASLARNAKSFRFSLDRIDVHINAQGTIDKISPKAR